jgi:hypothetical protein
MKTIRTLLASVALAALAHTPALAFCGFYAGKADANLFNEASQVVLVRDGNRTVLSMLNDYQGPLNAFALVVPTPTTLQKGQVRIADKLVFDRLDAYSSPRLAEYRDTDPCQLNFGWGLQPTPKLAYAAAPVNASRAPQADASARNQALGVTVEVQYTLEEYDIVSLSATQSDGLETWLHENGYSIPKGASAALMPYINQGMKFFVAKVNLKEQAKTGYTALRPLQFAFESEKFMLPLRLGMLNAPPDKAQDLIVYALTRQGRVESSNYRTVKLPANQNLPFFTKPKFQDFYKALFDNQASKEQHRVVFTEYFWDMGWCDPCAAEPLSSKELRDAGVFWVDGNADAQFEAMRAPAGALAPKIKAQAFGGAQPAMLTRLHVRYTANTFPEDLLFTQTRDRQNWQTRYVIQQPYDSSLSACSKQMAQADCEAMCRQRVTDIPRPREDGPNVYYRLKSPAELQSDCVTVCTTAKQNGLQSAATYYQQSLPTRLQAEKQTLAELTGWGLAQIEQMPDARKYSAAQEGREPVPPVQPVQPAKTWWERLFSFKQLH